MITIEDYVGPHSECEDWNPTRQENAERLCTSVNAMMMDLKMAGVTFPINPSTGSCVSGQTFGGFRPQTCTQGAPNSSHKEGLAVDLYDPHDEIDSWLLAHPDKLEEYGIYIEHPDDTHHWSHWSIKPPGSGRHIFKP